MHYLTIATSAANTTPRAMAMMSTLGVYPVVAGCLPAASL